MLKRDQIHVESREHPETGVTAVRASVNLMAELSIPPRAALQMRDAEGREVIERKLATMLFRHLYAEIANEIRDVDLEILEGVYSRHGLPPGLVDAVEAVRDKLARIVHDLSPAEWMREDNDGGGGAGLDVDADGRVILKPMPDCDVDSLKVIKNAAVVAARKLETRGGRNVADAGGAYRVLMDALCACGVM